LTAEEGVLLLMDMASRVEKPEPVAVQCFLRTIRKLGKRPREVAVRRDTMAAGILLVCNALGVMFFKVSCLPLTDMAYADLRRQMERS
jgi:hypothetical protein